MPLSLWRKKKKKKKKKGGGKALFAQQYLLWIKLRDLLEEPVVLSLSINMRDSNRQMPLYNPRKKLYGGVTTVLHRRIPSPEPRLLN
jgi:hypothetical protein